MTALKIEQCDRDALASFYRDHRIGMESMAKEIESDNWRVGSGDNELATLDMLARHRQQAEARAEGLERAVETLFDAIKHGDAAHQNWLKQAIDDHFAPALAAYRSRT